MKQNGIILLIQNYATLEYLSSSLSHAVDKMFFPLIFLMRLPTISIFSVITIKINIQRMIPFLFFIIFIIVKKSTCSSLSLLCSNLIFLIFWIMSSLEQSFQIKHHDDSQKSRERYAITPTEISTRIQFQIFDGGRSSIAPLVYYQYIRGVIHRTQAHLWCILLLHSRISMSQGRAQQLVSKLNTSFYVF